MLLILWVGVTLLILWVGVMILTLHNALTLLILHNTLTLHQIMNRVNVQHSERVTQVMIQRHIGRRERGKVRGDHAQVLKNQLIALEHRGLVRGELLEVLHHVIDVEVSDHALLVDEAANHLRRHLLVDLLTALEHQRLVARVQPEQHARQHL